MTGLVRSTVSPSSSSINRSTPWVEGCWGPMLMIMVSSSDRSTSMSEGSTATPSGSRSTAPTSRRSSPGSVAERRLSSWTPTAGGGSCVSGWTSGASPSPPVVAASSSLISGPVLP